MIFVEDLGELAYGMGEGVVLSKEVVAVGAEGEAADLPKSCDAEVCNMGFWGILLDERGVFLMYIAGSSSKKSELEGGEKESDHKE